MSIDRQSVCTRLDALYALRDDTFGVEQTKKDAQIASAIKEIHTMLDDMASSVQSDSVQRAWWQFCRGKALNARDEYNPEAETLLRHQFDWIRPMLKLGTHWVKQHSNAKTTNWLQFISAKRSHSQSNVTLVH
jgi:hypothetical protein